jgi:ribosome-associated protein
VKKNAPALAGKALVDCVVESALDKKAEEIVLQDLESVAGIADWFVILSGDNPIHNKAIADGIREALGGRGTRPWIVEGYEQGRWILIDYSDMVVHVMLRDVREYYQLERIWESCPTQTIAESLPED